MEEAVTIDGGGPNLYAWKGRFPGLVSFSLCHFLAPEYCLFSHMIFVYVFIDNAHCIVNMSGEAMYPLESSSYTYWDGKKYKVQCTIPGAAAGVKQSYDCPDRFVSPREEGDPRNCIQVISPQLSLSLSPFLIRPLHHLFLPLSFP
jgi:hypothetical protein